MEQSENKDVLDVTCGGRMMWFDKYHPDVLFTDIREEEHILCLVSYSRSKALSYEDVPSGTLVFKVGVFVEALVDGSCYVFIESFVNMSLSNH